KIRGNAEICAARHLDAPAKHGRNTRRAIPEDMTVDSGDTAWLLVACALVLFMTPGLALFYGGMVRRKNVLATLMHSFAALPLVTIQWVLIGYSLSFGATHGGLIGGFDYVGLHGVAFEAKGSV